MYNSKLTIQERLEDLRKERKLTLEQLAEQTGLSKTALGSYETDYTKDISHYAIIKLAKFYGVTTDYLLGLSEMKKHPNAELNDLHLSDGMIELLRNNQINTPLLCELSTHRDFVKLLADIEVYVDGMAAEQIQNLNAWVDAARAQIIQKYQPGEDDITTAMMKAVRIHEGEYFSQRVHDDIDSIIADMKKKRAGRSTDVPISSAVIEFKETLEQVANIKGSRLEKLIFLFCKQTKIQYKKLTEEEKRWLIQIAKKSELVRSHIPQRGKHRK